MKWSNSTASRRARDRVIICLVGILILLSGTNAWSGPLADSQMKRLEHLVRHDCGSCHGMTLKGGLGPALLPARLANRDEEGLVQMILHGNPARAMPPWRHLLNEAEVRWIVRRLKQGLDTEGNRQ